MSSSAPPQQCLLLRLSGLHLHDTFLPFSSFHEVVLMDFLELDDRASTMIPYRQRGLSPSMAGMAGMPGVAGSLGSRRPWLERRPSEMESALISVREDALSSILPTFAPLASHYEPDTYTLMDQLISTSPELPPTTTWNPLSPPEICHVYEWILRLISRSSYSDLDLLLSQELTHELDHSFLSDATSLSPRGISIGGGGGTCVYLRCQRLFRTLAEISHHSGSVRIGDVLAGFFLQRGGEVAAAESSDALGQWCFAVLRAAMREEDKVESLRLVLRVRPDLAARLVGRGRKGEEVSAVLERILSSSLSLRPGLASSISGPRTQSRVRGVDIDLSLHIGNGRSTPLVRERGNPLDDGIRVRGMDAIDAERELARDGRRMLNLTLGRRYGDRYDDVGGIERLGGVNRLEGGGRLDGIGAGGRLGGVYDRLGGMGMDGSRLHHEGLARGRMTGRLDDEYTSTI